MNSPCKDCPFRKDSLKGWLGKPRIIEILGQDSFVCHKTAHKADKDKRQCAGHMIVNSARNIFVRILRIMKLPINLFNKHLVFDNIEDCITHHSNEGQDNESN